MQNAFGPRRIYSKYEDKILSCPWTVSIFFGMEVSGTVFITKLVDTGTKEALGGQQPPPLEMERLV